MFSDFCLSSLLICIIVIIVDMPTGIYYNFCLPSLSSCITVIIGDKPTGLYTACKRERERERERESLFATKYKKNIQNHSKYNNSGRLPDR